MYTMPHVKSTIKDNTNKKNMFKDIYETLEKIDINKFSTKKISGTSVRYFQIGKEAFLGSSFTKTIDLGSSHSERYYLVEKDNELKFIIASETGGGYINRGHSAYFHSFYCIYGDCPFTLEDITNVNELNDRIKNYVGSFKDNPDNIEGVSEKDLKSFLRSALTKNYGKEVVFFKKGLKESSKTISSEDFMKLFRNKMKLKIKDFAKKYPENNRAYLFSESDIEIIEFLNKKFKNQLMISHNERRILDILVTNELFDYLYKDKLTELDYYYYHYDYSLEKLSSLLKDYQINYKMYSGEEIEMQLYYRETKHNFIVDLQHKLKAYDEVLEKQSRTLIEDIIQIEEKSIQKKKDNTFIEINKKLKKYFDKMDIQYSIRIQDDVATNSHLNIYIQINSIDEI